MDLTLVAVVVVALFFDFTNGFHDTANSIATSVSTRALSPRAAVVSAAILNFAGAFVSFEVAATVAKGIVSPEGITLEVLLAGLVGAITWNLLTWYLGLPSSSSHALIGGIAGSAIAAAGFDVVQWHGLVEKVVIPSLLAPLFGVLGAAAIMFVLVWIIRRRSPGLVNRVFRRLQLVSGGFVAFTHGTNDAQKTMGIIALALVAAGELDPDFSRPPLWVIVSAALAMAAGTYAGGWRIIKTLGQRIAKLDPPQGFAAQTATAAILFTTAHYGFPGLDHAHGQWLRPRRRRVAEAQGRALGRGREHPPRLDHDDPVRGARRCGHGGTPDAPTRRQHPRIRARRGDCGGRISRPLLADAAARSEAGLGPAAVRPAVRVRGVRELAKLTGDEEGGLLSDVDGVIADPLETAGDEDHAKPPLTELRLSSKREDVVDQPAVRRVDQLVQVDEELGSFEVAVGERLERDDEHLLGPLPISSRPSTSEASPSSASASLTSLAIVTQ